MHSNTRKWPKVAAMAVALGVLAVACSGGDPVEPAAAIQTNDGGVSVRPPDVLEGDPLPSPDPLADADTETAELGPKIDGAPDTPIVDLAYFDGSMGSTADFAGTPTVLNFWASNCAACIAEMPEFEEVHQLLDGQVNFVGVNVADTREAADRLAGQTGVTYPLADDAQSLVFRQFGGFVMPTTVLLNPQGQVAFTWSGVLTGDELQKLIDEHILPGSLSDV